MAASSLLGRAYGTDRGRIEQAAARRWSLLYSPYRTAIDHAIDFEREADLRAFGRAAAAEGECPWQRSD
jgi:hypothetical protein